MTRHPLPVVSDRPQLAAAWLLRPGGPAWAAALTTLGTADRERLDALSDPYARVRLVTGRWELRRLAAARLGVAASDVTISARCPECGGQHGVPKVSAVDGRSLVASVSHGGGAVLASVADEGPLGVDLVDPDEADFSGFEESVMPLGAGMTVEPPEHPPHRALWRARVWAAKEAALKSIGYGLAISPAAVHLGEPGSEHGTAARIELPGGGDVLLRVTPVDTMNGLVAAVARGSRLDFNGSGPADGVTR